MIFFGKYICTPIVRSRLTWMPCFEREYHNPLREMANTKNDIIYFAVVRLQHKQRRIILHSCRTSDSVLVIEEKLDTATRAREGDGGGKERRSVREDFQWPVLSFPFLSVARAVHAPALRDEQNTPAGSSATRHRWTCVFSCMSSSIQYPKVRLFIQKLLAGR